MMPVYKKGKIYYAVVERGRDPVTNKRIQQWVRSGPTKKGAQELLTRLNHERDTGTMLDANTMTTGAYLDHWLETVVKGKRRTTTYERYGAAIRNQLAPHIGTIGLQKLTPLHLSRMYGILIAAGLSASSITSAHNVIHGALKQAVRWQMVARNVADAARPAVSAPPTAVDIDSLWTHEQTRHFLAMLTGERLRAFFVVEINTGMRRGEMIGLRWPAVDLASGSASRGACSSSPPRPLRGGAASSSRRTPPRSCANTMPCKRSSASGSATAGHPASTSLPRRAAVSCTRARSINCGDDWSGKPGPHICPSIICVTSMPRSSSTLGSIPRWCRSG